VKSSAFNRFASKRTCGKTGLRRRIAGKKVCVEAVVYPALTTQLSQLCWFRHVNI